MTVPQYAQELGTILGELAAWYEFARGTAYPGFHRGTAIAVPYADRAKDCIQVSKIQISYIIAKCPRIVYT